MFRYNAMFVWLPGFQDVMLVGDLCVAMEVI